MQLEKIAFVKGQQIQGETLEDMEIRERVTEAINARIDYLRADWERQRKTPMPAMREWARARGIYFGLYVLPKPTTDA